VQPTQVIGELPVKVCDHESLSPFLTSVKFSLNPLDGRVIRLD
jgi:hypothetical protein